MLRTLRIALATGAAAVAGATLFAAAQPPAPPVLAFTNVTVVPMDRERLLAGHTVIVRGSRIDTVGPSASVTVPAGATTVDGTGRFLIPGLAEMHGHLMPPQTQAGASQEALNERLLELSVLRGITTVRGMLGHPYHLQLRARVAQGTLLGPTIYTSGPSLNGNTVPDAAAAVKLVTEQKAAGYDFLKIHPGIALAPFNAIAETAKKVGTTLQGHVPVDVGLARALAIPYRAIDHLDGYVEALAGWTPGAQAPEPGFFGSKLAANIDSARLPALVADTKRAGVWMVPTEAVVHSFLSTVPPQETLKAPEMRYVPQTMRDNWLKQKTGFNDGGGLGTAEQRHAFFALRRRLIKALHDGGVKILTGADTPQVMNVPGYATHRELVLLAEAGLTPYQVLEASTRNVAEFFGTADRGTIAAGKVADLVLVDANPLADIANAATISGVVVRGRWIAKDEIESRLVKLAAN